MNARALPSIANHYDLAELSDEALIAGTRGLVATANHALAALLAHLAEVEARGIHRARACASLYTYCIYELRMSEDAAFRRAKAARLCRSFPALYESVAAGELHLTGLLMLGPHLTEDNLAEVLTRSKHRTKREIKKLLRELDPLPDVPARIDPLGPDRVVATPRPPSWSDSVASFSPVRDLRPGERPADWLDGGGDDEDEAADSDQRRRHAAREPDAPTQTRYQLARITVQFGACRGPRAAKRFRCRAERKGEGYLLDRRPAPGRQRCGRPLDV